MATFQHHTFGYWAQIMEYYNIRLRLRNDHGSVKRIPLAMKVRLVRTLLNHMRRGIMEFSLLRVQDETAEMIISVRMQLGIRLSYLHDETFQGLLQIIK